MLDPNEVITARTKIEKVIVRWMTEDDIMFNIMCMLDKNASTSQKTIGIKVNGSNTTPSIEFNPKFVLKVSEEVLEAVILNEGYKILLKHATTRLREPRTISSLASQITTIQLLDQIDTGTTISEFAYGPEDFGLEKNLYFEEYHRQLSNDSDNVDKQIQKNRVQSKASGPADKFKNVATGGDEQGSGPGDDEPQDFENEQEAMNEYFDPESTSNKDWGSNDMFDAEMKNMIDNKKGSSKSWGKYTGGFIEQIVAAYETKISFREILRRFNTSVTRTSQYDTRMKVNRRYGLKAPGKARKTISKIIFAIDVSGSMSSLELSHGLKTMNSICKHSDVEYVIFDTEIKDHGKFKHAQNSFKVAGRGGTDFSCICDYANENKVDGLVIFTDGEAPPPQRKPKCRTLWLLTGKTRNAPVDWGFKAHLDLND